MKKNAGDHARRASAKAETAGGELARELEHARSAALEAGEILRRYFRDSGYEGGTKGSDNPVPSADLEADAALREHLSGAFPDYGWLSEETADNPARLSRRRVWIVDPLDGTKEFIKKIPEFAVSIALVEDGVPVLGVTYNPTGRLFWAVRGQGAWCEGQRLQVSPTQRLADATILSSRSETKRRE